MKEKVLQLFVKHKKWFYFAAGILLIIVLCLIIFLLHKDKQDTEINVPQYTTDTSFDTRKNVDKSLKKQGIPVPKKPKIVYTKTEPEGDRIAQDFARENKSDTIIKERDTTPVIVPGTKQDTGNTMVYSNTYYAVSTEKKHDIKAGVAVIDDKAAAVVTYRNRDTSYSVYTDGHKATGAAVQYTIAKW